MAKPPYNSIIAFVLGLLAVLMSYEFHRNFNSQMSPKTPWLASLSPSTAEKLSNISNICKFVRREQRKRPPLRPTSTNNMLTDSRVKAPFIFKIYDELLRTSYPGTIDLIVRYGREDSSILLPFLNSVHLFWPKNIGRLIMFVEPDDVAVSTMVPEYWEVEKERINPLLAGIDYLTANFDTLLWADNYTTADYVAFIPSVHSLLLAKVKKKQESNQHMQKTSENKLK
jgi:hypothetical protein